MVFYITVFGPVIGWEAPAIITQEEALKTVKTNYKNLTENTILIGFFNGDRYYDDGSMYYAENKT